MERKDTYYVPSMQQTVDAGEFAGERDIEIQALKKLSGKNNNAFMMGMRNLDEPVSIGAFDGYLERKAKEQGLPMKSSTLEAAKGFAEGVLKAPARWAGYAATNTLPLIAKTATSLYALSGAAGDVESSDKWVREANKGIEAWTKEVQRITGIEDASTVENVVGNALGSVWGSVAIGGIFGGGSVAPMFGASAMQDTYVRQREAGTGMGESLVRGAIHGTGEAALERLQFNRIFGSLAKKSKPIAIVKDLLENAVQEGLQQANELGANWNIDNRSLIEKLQEIGVSMVGGAVASLGGSVGGNILNRNTVNEVGDLMKKTGHSDEEIASVKNELNKIVDTDELQQAANQVAKDELTTVALTYKEQAQAASDALVVGLEDTIKRNELVDMGGALSGDKTEGMPPLYQLGDIQIDTTKNPNIGMVLYQAEQAGQPMQTLGQVLDWTKGKLNLEQARKMNTGINAVYNNAYQQLKAIGQDETLADANARVRSAMAYTLAKNYDMTPEQADNMLGGIISQRASEFQGKPRTYEEVKQEQTVRLKGIAERIAKDIQATYGDKYSWDFSYLSKLIDDYSDLYETSMRANIQRYDDNEIYGAQGTDTNAPDIDEVLSDFGKEIAYEPGVYKDYAQIGYDEFMNRVKNEFERGLDRGDMVLLQSDLAQRINEIDAEEQAKGVPEYTAPTININGVERQTTNSSGGPIAKSEKSLRYFYDWFGDSKVVDEQGRPLVVYHGGGKFDVFKYSYDGTYYFTTNKGYAERYANDYIDERGRKGLGELKAVYLKIENPAPQDVMNRETLDQVIAQGYDGHIFDDVLSENDDKIIRAFNPNQIKSTSNRGTYSLTENNIYHQDGYEVKKVDKDQNLSEFRNKNEEYNKKSKDYFGTTYRMAEAGYILTDGELLDFSGKKFGGPAGQRTMDHRQVNEIDVSMEDFINSGNIRFMPEGDKILMSNYPTQKQFDMIRRAVGLSRGTFTVELMSDAQKWGMNRNDFYGEYEYGTPFTKIKRDIDAFYKGDGVRPEMAFYQSAYHGTGSLELEGGKFSVEKIGSGEGHDAHGHGIYAAADYSIADKKYREMLANALYGEESNFFKEDVLQEEYNKQEEKASKSKSQKEWDKLSILEEMLIKHEEMSVLESDEFSEDVKDWYNKNIREKVINKERKQGNVFSLDIPENAYLINEQLKYENQPDIVKNAIDTIIKEAPENYPNKKKLMETYKDKTGAYLYLYASDIEYFKKHGTNRGVMDTKSDAKKLASERLNKLGVKGITYDGSEDGRSFVIFNPDDVKVIQKFYQDEANPRGAYYNNTVYLFENANESTFVHEMAHSYMDVLERLSQNGNAKAQSDLNVIRNWLGKKQGESFTQADWERFARGFEMYMREGKSPNQYLGGEKGVFARFRDWLMHIYAGIKSLRVKNEKGVEEPVRINNQIRRFYDEMLGGTSIDEVFDTAEKNKQSLEVLDNKLKQLAEAQQKLAEEKAKLVREMANNVKTDTTWANVKDWGKNVWESAKELPSNVLQSSYERLAKIDSRLGLLVQKAEQAQGLRLKKWADEVQPFYEAFNKLSNDDKAKVQYFLLNQQWGDVEDIIGKEGTEAVHGMLEEIYNELQDSGVEVGYRDNYFPRAVLDYDGLLQEMGLTYPSLRKEMEEAIGKDATPQEQAEWLDKHIMGFKGTVSTSGNRNTKERKLDLITDRMAQYYKPSMETLVDYMNGMAKLLSMREAFGKDIEYKESTAEDSIGKIINRLFGDKKFTKKEIDEVRDVLSALYLPSGMGNKFLQAMRQYGYATKLSYSTTVRQFADIGMMMKVNGVLNTLDALFHPDKRITLENLGIDPLGEEFNTSKTDIGGKIANISTKWKGINWADAVMKNAFMRGNYKDLQKLAKTPEKFHKKYDSIFGDEVDTLIKDLNADKITEPVKVLLFHEISKIQPISRSAMPTAYLQNPNGRVFYMFKTFSLHRAEYMVSELADDFRRGDFKKAGKDIMADVAVIGWEGLVELLITFLKYGWQALAAEAVLETFAGSGLGVLGLNKHQALQLTRGQIGDFFQQMVGVGTPLDDIGYLIRHYDDDDKLLRAFLPDMIIEPLVAGPKELK